MPEIYLEKKLCSDAADMQVELLKAIDEQGVEAPEPSELTQAFRAIQKAHDVSSELRATITVTIKFRCCTITIKIEF